MTRSETKTVGTVWVPRAGCTAIWIYFQEYTILHNFFQFLWATVGKLNGNFSRPPSSALTLFPQRWSRFIDELGWARASSIFWIPSSSIQQFRSNSVWSEILEPEMTFAKFVAPSDWIRLSDKSRHSSLCKTGHSRTALFPLWQSV